ncbi:hypothetical protein [Streptomyces mirabilis]|uniref:hypothetical protein n=1 Tax=Streptomyces mirabilis TaxID=68239 RepID=UPI0031BA97C9
MSSPITDELARLEVARQRGAFGHTQRTGDFAAARRRDRAWQAFWQHCEDWADCDPTGIPCRTYGMLW